MCCFHPFKSQRQMAGEIVYCCYLHAWAPYRQKGDLPLLVPVLSYLITEMGSLESLGIQRLHVVSSDISSKIPQFKPYFHHPLGMPILPVTPNIVHNMVPSYPRPPSCWNKSPYRQIHCKQITPATSPNSFLILSKGLYQARENKLTSSSSQGDKWFWPAVFVWLWVCSSAGEVENKGGVGGNHVSAQERQWRKTLLSEGNFFFCCAGHQRAVGVGGGGNSFSFSLFSFCVWCWERGSLGKRGGGSSVLGGWFIDMGLPFPQSML